MSYRSYTGVCAVKRLAHSVAYESSLEHAFISLMDFDAAVTGIEGQPVRVNWRDARGRKHHYTPDFLIHFKPSAEQFPPHQPGKTRPWLVEIKDAKTLREQWSDLRPRFRAAVAYARERGWIFHLFTERYLCSERLENARLLLLALDLPEDSSLCSRLLQELTTLGEATPPTLAAAVCGGTADRTACLQALWLLLAQRRVEMDLDVPLSMESRLRMPGNHFVDALIRPKR